MECHRNVTGKIRKWDHVPLVNITHAFAIQYLDPAVEDALYTPRETPELTPTQPTDAMADDLGTEWDEGEIRPNWWKTCRTRDAPSAFLED